MLASLRMSLKTPISLLIALATLAHGVEFRAVSYNIGAHFTVDGFPDYSLGAPGTPDHDKVRDVLARINADVVALQEIASADVSGNDVQALATGLGYPYIYIAPVTQASPLNGPIDTSLRVAFLSRYPFLTTEVIRSPQGAKEITRLFPVVKVNIPGTNLDPVIISGHLKSGTTTSDRFRRTVEMKRLTGFLAAKGLTTDDNFIIMGDFNLSSNNTTFTTLPPDLPASYDLGGDIDLPISYSTNPISYFSSPGVTRITPRQLNNSTSTFQSGSTIDLFLVSPAIAGRPLATEVYNSTLDTSNLTGLAKAGQPLPAGTSAAASDHYAIFGDFELDQDYPNLASSLSVPSVLEGTADGTAQLTVTLPATRTSAVTVSVVSDDPEAADILTPEIVIPAGSLSGVTAVRTVRNFIEDPERSVTFTATATQYDPASRVLQVTDADGPYVLTTPGQTILQSFTGFDGTHDPAQWITTGGSWRGTEAGTSATAGFRAYGNGNDGSVGFMPAGGAGSATATFFNGSPQVLTSIQVSFHAEQWRSANGGTADNLTVSVIQNGVTTSLPSLTFNAATNLTNGAVAGGTSALKTATVTGLTVAPGATLELRFDFTPGVGGGSLPADVFVNEFHYDNDSLDQGEFIEVVVGPGFTGNASDIDVLLYNGGNGTVYDTVNLGSEFSHVGTVDGFKFHVANFPQDGIQNGTPDGIAVVNRITSQVIHFLSYEGSPFVATNGIASGTTSTLIGVTQNGSEAVGVSALGLTGTGSVRTNFAWTKIAGAYTKGLPNTGQTFVIPSVPSQGVAIDNLSVTFVPDNDADGIPDTADPDDDNDTMTDADEFVFGSNSFDAGSRFAAAFSRPAPSAVRFSLPTTAGRTYVIESSDDLSDWEDEATRAGNGSPWVVDLPVVIGEPLKFYRVRAATN